MFLRNFKFLCCIIHEDDYYLPVITVYLFGPLLVNNSNIHELTMNIDLVFN